jgi:hypothetical protein
VSRGGCSPRRGEPAGRHVPGIADRGDLKQENEKRNEQVEALSSACGAAERRTADRGAGGGAGREAEPPDDQLLAANVIAEEPSNLKRMAAIDRGSDDGLDEGDGGAVAQRKPVDDRSGVQRLLVDSLVTDPRERRQRAGEHRGTDDGAFRHAGAERDAIAEPPGAVRAVAEGDLRQEDHAGLAAA